MKAFTMHRLFWKIFVSFWLSLILFVGGSLVAASLFIEHARVDNEDNSPRARFRMHLDEARRIGRIEGIEGLKTWLRDIDRREVVPLLLLDLEGKDLLNRPVPRYLARLNAPFDAPPLHQGRRPPPRHGLVRTAEGTELRLLPDFRAVTLGRILTRPRVIALPMIVAAIVSGFVCFFLARYLARPIRRLSQVTRQYAAGDLAVRVAPTMGGRKDEIADLARDFDDMAAHLQTLLAAQRQLLRDVSHELRSPLARLQVALGLARQRGTDAESRELDRIEVEAERLNELIAQLLSLSRMEAESALTRTDKIDLVQLLTEVVEAADYEARALDRHVAIATMQAISIEADAELLTSALENVVRNAIRYTAVHTTVEVSLAADNRREDWVCLRVSDHGPGVPDDMLARLFEPFVRVGEARDRDSGGYGLGLSIAQRAVRLHGGEITADNGSDSGLTITIRLPRDQRSGTRFAETK